MRRRRFFALLLLAAVTAMARVSFAQNAGGVSGGVPAPIPLSAGGLIANSDLDSSSVTKQGNQFNAASQLLQLNSSALVPNANVDQSSVTKLTAAGLVPNSLIDSSSVTKWGNAITGNSGITVSVLPTGVVVSTNGSIIIAVNRLRSGPIDSALFPSTVPYTSSTNTWSAQQVFNNPVLNLSSVTSLGVPDASNAPPGYVGEYISTSPLTTLNLVASGIWTSISTTTLTAGDWDVQGFCALDMGGTFAGNLFQCGVSLTANTVDNRTGNISVAAAGVANDSQYLPTMVRRISTASTIAVYLTANVTYTVNGGSTWGTTPTYMRARRVR